MSAETFGQFVTGDDRAVVDISIVMPCLNEAGCLAICIANAAEALALIAGRYGLSGEIVIADNGSTDGSQAIAIAHGARVHPVPVRGYGAALIGGAHAARGRYIVMGDADGSYDFRESVAMIGELAKGADLCMGSRFKGGIAPGAMPWKNRYIGNPILTGLLNLMFRTGIGDAHCGLRAVRRDALLRMRLTGTGMEFASEMVIKAALQGCVIREVPATLSPDLRDRAPHLRPWRDGWRHLRYLFMLSPTWVFAMPALAAMGAASLIFIVALAHLLGFAEGAGPFGTSWTITAGFLFTTGHFALLMAMATHFHGVQDGYRQLRPLFRRHARLLTLETAIITGLAMMTTSLACFVAIGIYWSGSGFAQLPNTLPLVLAAVLGATGAQTSFGGFLLSIVSGHRADFAAECGVQEVRAITMPALQNAA